MEFFLLLSVAELLNVDGVFHLEALLHRWLVILLTGAKLAYYTCAFKLSFELLESSLNVLTILNWYDNHSFCFFDI